MTRRHRSEGLTGALLASTGGGGGGGGCGCLLLLFFVAVVVEYWWVFALILGAVIVGLAIRAMYRNPDRRSLPPLGGDTRPAQPRVAKPPRPEARAVEPKRKKDPPLSGDALTAKLRDDKRRRRGQALEEWDRDWDRLLGPGPNRRAAGSPGQGKRPPGSRQSSAADRSSDAAVPPRTEGQPSFRVGQPVTITKRIPANAAYPAQAESGSTGTVVHVGPPNRAPGLCPIQVRLDRTGRVVVVLEKYLAPRAGGTRGR